MTSQVVEYENLMNSSFTDANTSVRSSTMPRWERKKLAASTRNNEVPPSTVGTKTVPTHTRTPSKTPSKSRRPETKENAGVCRYIPNRNNMDMQISQARLNNSTAEEDGSNGNSNNTNNMNPPVESDDADTMDSVTSTASFKNALSTALEIEGGGQGSRILTFKEKAPQPKGDTVNNLKVLYSGSCESSRSVAAAGAKMVTRHIPSAPSRILDAPDLLDDYYLNLLHWNDKNILAVALSQTVYLWNAGSGDIQELCTLDDGTSEAYISSVKWVQEGGQHVAIGTSTGKTQLWDVHAGKQLRSMDGHSERVGAMSWNKHVLTTGSRDSTIINHDVRIARHAIGTMCSHTQEVCGLEWSPDGTTLASGGNDNMLCLWDAQTSHDQSPRFQKGEHQAAVKALAWSPHDRNLLATGGGTADRTIKFWNTGTGSLLNSIDTGSQVCALQWNRHEREILSSHGFAQNQLCLWKYPTMAKVKELKGHTARVLHMAQSPDGCTVVSAAADETLRFWNVFGEGGKKRKAGAEGKGRKLSKTMHIR